MVKTIIKLPVTSEGMNIIDATGNRIAVCGLNYNMAKTGQTVAEELVGLINSSNVTEGKKPAQSIAKTREDKNTKIKPKIRERHSDDN